ncbi:MAG TPA: M23 family metallopeptidase [Rhizomicrobium sp.]|nr:M23 family metallopeptidase [Rhizomicrobium sp.]
MRFLFASALAIAALAPSLVLAAPEIRFCPAAQVRTYPLESRRNVNSLVLQNVAIINHDAAPLNVSAVTIELLNGGAVEDQRRLTGGVLAHSGDAGRSIQAAGMVAAVAFQFCGKDLIAPGVKLGGPNLASGEALLVAQQVFGYNGARDSLRVRVEGTQGGKPASFSASLPIRSDSSKIAYRFPLRGVWYIGNGPTPYTGHRWAIPEEFAYDIARLDEGGLSHNGNGTKFTDYYDYGADVLAAANGHVALAHDGEPEDPKAMRQPGESIDAYFKRLLGDQAARLAKGTAGLAGNYVMIDHGNGEYSLYAHLQPGSVAVHEGDIVHAGDRIGKLGSSGNSTEPHLHFQVCDRADPLMCAGIPITFTDIELPYADFTRPVQSGDIVIAR